MMPYTKEIFEEKNAVNMDTCFGIVMKKTSDDEFRIPWQNKYSGPSCLFTNYRNSYPNQLIQKSINLLFKGENSIGRRFAAFGKNLLRPGKK